MAKLPKLTNYFTTAVTGDTVNNVQSVGYAGAPTAAAAAAAAANVSCEVFVRPCPDDNTLLRKHTCIASFWQTIHTDPENAAPENALF